MRASWLRGVVVLAVLGAFTGMTLAAPVSAALSKATVKKIAKKTANQVLTQRSTEFLGNTMVATVKQNLPPNDAGRLTVNCPLGLQATHGGVDSPAFFTGPTSDSAVVIAESKPVVSGTTSTGWEVEVLSQSPAGLELTAYAVCSP